MLTISENNPTLEQLCAMADGAHRVAGNRLVRGADDLNSESPH